MKAITVRPPYGWAILNGKSPENRSRNIAGHYRGPLIIHQGKRPIPSDNPGRDLIWRLSGRLPLVEHPSSLGAALGIVDLVGVHRARPDNLGNIRCDDGNPGALACSPWAMETDWHLSLANPRWFPAPIPYKGCLGLWNFPDELIPEGFTDHG